MQCEICKTNLKNNNGLAKHITNQHKDITKEEYFNTYIATANPICVCGKKKKFRDMGVGYSAFCSLACSRGSDEYKTKLREINTGNKQSKETIQKRQNTTLERYGVVNGFMTGQHPQIFTYKGFTTRSSYERDFLDFAEEYEYTISVPEKIRYTFEDRDRWYYPDFYIKELDVIIEVKSKWTYELHKDMNEAKKVFTKLAGFDIILIDETNGLTTDWKKLNEYLRVR